MQDISDMNSGVTVHNVIIRPADVYLLYVCMCACD